MSTEAMTARSRASAGTAGLRVLPTRTPMPLPASAFRHRDASSRSLVRRCLHQSQKVSVGGVGFPQPSRFVLLSVPAAPRTGQFIYYRRPRYFSFDAGSSFLWQFLPSGRLLSAGLRSEPTPLPPPLCDSRGLRRSGELAGGRKEGIRLLHPELHGGCLHVEPAELLASPARLSFLSADL